MNNVEIERKWRLAEFPDMPLETERYMEQGYISFAPAVRIRKVVENGEASYVLTLKGQGTLQRTEVELPLEPEQYAALQGMLAGPPARKLWRAYRLPEGLLECNLVDEGEATSFMYAEVEFDSPEAAGAFVPPAFLGRELTEINGLSMAAYCRMKAGQGEFCLPE